MLKYILKTRQTVCTIYTRIGNGTENTYAYDASASGCGASWPTETATWKRRSNLPLIASFQLVEKAWNDFRQVAF